MKIKGNSLIYMLVFISIFKPMMFNYWDIADLIANSLSVVFFLIFSILVFFRWLKIHKINTMTVLIMLMHTLIFVSTYRYNGNIKHWGMALTSSGTLALFLERYASDIKNIIRTWFPIVELFLFINFLSILMGGIGDGTWLTDYFLGSKNTFQVVFATFMLIIYFHKVFFHSSKANLHYLLCYILMIFAIVITHSSTMIMEFLIFVILLVLSGKPKFSKLFEYRNLLIFYCVISIILLYSAFNSRLEFATDYLEFETSKGSASVLERFKMWASGIELIQMFPFWGVGRMSEEMWNIYMQAGEYKTQLHNQIIEYMVTGGVILLFILVSIYIKAARQIHEYSGCRIAMMLSLICFSLNIANMMEAYYNALYFFPFLISGYITYVVDESKFSIKRINRCHKA